MFERHKCCTIMSKAQAGQFNDSHDAPQRYLDGGGD